VGDTSLDAPEGVNLPESPEKGSISIHDDPLQGLALQIHQKPSPILRVLDLGKPEGEQFLGSIGMDSKSTEHPLAFHPDLPDLLAGPVEEQEDDAIGQRLAWVGLEVGIQGGDDVRHGPGTHGCTEEVLGEGFELPGADALQKELADGGIGSDRSRRSPCPLPGAGGILKRRRGPCRVIRSVAVPMSLTAFRPLVSSRTQMGAHLVLQQGLFASEEAGGDFAPNCGLEIFSDLLYTLPRWGLLGSSPRGGVPPWLRLLARFPARIHPLRISTR